MQNDIFSCFEYIHIKKGSKQYTLNQVINISTDDKPGLMMPRFTYINKCHQDSLI